MRPRGEQRIMMRDSAIGGDSGVPELEGPRRWKTFELKRPSFKKKTSSIAMVKLLASGCALLFHTNIFRFSSHLN